MGRFFKTVILGGGTAAGYAADEFVRRGVSGSELCIISDEQVPPYERPALSKGYLLPENAVRLPSFFTCIATGQGAHGTKWYKQNGVELILSTRVTSVDVARRRLVTSQGETIAFNTLIVATGARALRMEEFGVRGSNCGRICYLRNLADADHLLECITSLRKEASVSQQRVVAEPTDSSRDAQGGSNRNETYVADSQESSSNGATSNRIRAGDVGQQGQDTGALTGPAPGSNKATIRAVVIGGGYIGMEATAALVENGVSVTIVFPEAHCMPRLFTPAIAAYYEREYSRRGVAFIKGALIVGFESHEGTKNVSSVVLRDGRKLPADLVVVGIGIRPNTALFEGQLAIDAGGIRVNSHLQSVSSPWVYAVGDVASFPLLPVPPFAKSSAVIRRVEHVDHARKSAVAAVSAIFAPRGTPPYEYLPFFYSRVFSLSWQFYGHNVGQCVLFGLDEGASGELSQGSSVLEQQSASKDVMPEPKRDTVTALAQSKPAKFGAFWVEKGRVVGVFLEGGTRAEYEAAAVVARACPPVPSTAEALAEAGAGGLMHLAESLRASQNGGWGSFWKGGSQPSSSAAGEQGREMEMRELGVAHVAIGIAAAVAIVALAYWHGKRFRNRW